eukprot:SAG22_NODE_847_length_6866_cov_6.246638_2_plen_69_part_00
MRRNSAADPNVWSTSTGVNERGNGGNGDEGRDMDDGETEEGADDIKGIMETIVPYGRGWGTKFVAFTI